MSTERGLTSVCSTKYMYFSIDCVETISWLFIKRLLKSSSVSVLGFWVFFSGLTHARGGLCSLRCVPSPLGCYILIIIFLGKRFFSSGSLLQMMIEFFGDSSTHVYSML